MLNERDPRLAGRVAFTYPNFVAYTFARFFVNFSLEMQSVAVGWQVFEITRRPLDLGYVGLAQFVPPFLLFLIAGQVVDVADRRKLLVSCYAGFAFCSALLLAISWRAPHSVHPIYAVLVLVGVCRSFAFPVSRAILPHLVPEEHFSNAVAWNASTFQMASIGGPALGGIAYALFRGPEAVYLIGVVVSVVSVFATRRLHLLNARKSSQTGAEPVAEGKGSVAIAPVRARQEPSSLRTVLAGFRFIGEKKLILGSISLDMFAVLLGGAVALLPVYAKDILHTGPWGLGILRSAPGVGAALTAIVVAHYPIHRRAGPVMLMAVAGFGVFTIVFGISRNLVVSLIALFLTGAADMVSVIIRAMLIQLATPDSMRGRVNAVDMLFIGVSNELGEFESGLTAQWFGTVPAVIVGGIGTLAVIGVWAWIFPELRKADRLTFDELASQ
jgi:MFS family permease